MRVRVRVPRRVVLRDLSYPVALVEVIPLVQVVNLVHRSTDLRLPGALPSRQKLAPLIEEPTKAIILFAIVRSRHFDNTTDGFVYGAAAGLGFAMTENFMYFGS